MKIQAAVARAAHEPFSLDQVDIEEPRADEVLIQIHGVGLCHTDLIARDQFIPIPLPAVLGHEGAGVVLAAGEGVTKVKPGDRVVMSFASCGRCARCHENLPSYCASFTTLNYSGWRDDGSSGVSIGARQISASFFGQSSFASHALTRERNVVKIDDLICRSRFSGPWGAVFRPVQAR